MARLAQIVIDSVVPSHLAGFWASVLDGFQVRPYDDSEIQRLASLDLTPDTDPTVLVDGPSLEICFQQIKAGSAGKQRVHLDLVAEDRQAEVERLVALGASIREDFKNHTGLLDPEGNDFCVADA